MKKLITLIIFILFPLVIFCFGIEDVQTYKAIYTNKSFFINTKTYEVIEEYYKAPNNFHINITEYRHSPNEIIRDTVFINFPMQTITYNKKNNKWFIRVTAIPWNKHKRKGRSKINIQQHADVPIIYPILTAKNREEIKRLLSEFPVTRKMMSIITSKTSIITKRKMKYYKAPSSSINIERDKKVFLPKKIDYKSGNTILKLYVDYNIELEDRIFCVNTNEFNLVKQKSK